MSQRMNILGKGQGLDGDLTSTGATCLATQARGTTYGRRWLLEGDKTTPCPRCGKEGKIIDGESRWCQDGIPAAVDGTPVECGCTPGSNHVLAPLDQRIAPHTAPSPQTVAASPYMASAYQPRHPLSNVAANAVSTVPDGLEPGFHIVQHGTSFPQLLMKLFDKHGSVPVARLQRLNPTFNQGFKAGEIFVIGDPSNGHACTREEAQLMAAAERAREALADVGHDQANFMMRNHAEIASLLSDVSLSMGVAQAMMTKSLEELQATLRYIEKLHQQQFLEHGHLKSPAFFNQRKKLFQQLDAQLKMSFLNKYMDLGSHETLRRGLGISSKSLIHHWNKAGAPGAIPGYTTHLDKLARLSRYLKNGGRAGIVIGGASSFLKIKEACRANETEACKKIRFTEAGSFAVGLSGGVLGGALGKSGALVVCLGLGPVSATACSLVMVGAGSLAGSMGGMKGGKMLGEVIYEYIENE
ncbi:PAAR domain-containing protein [Pseudomonas oryziphila]|uniref:PAAR domain-containing protein n=1 Tax=Pseudomonas oryziphila TaxID=2894079 RepID=A0ABM7CQ29_9PSED|nr:PAAR domain-containing protein [Pseudomonas oryziphila]AZL73539.1 PAAR domain-containing protein [Pseudomonas oryziphila]